MDLLKLSVDIPRSSVSRLNLARSLPSIAESIVVIGSPYGLEQTISEGIISSVRDVPNVGKLLQISAPISSGSSGSPVLNMKGDVVGIVSFFFLGGQNLNFAIPTQYLLDLKPSETFKTISEWSGKDVCRLYVHTEPEEAMVRILNINTKFFQGIVLKPGSYHIEISLDGYKTEKVWIKTEPGEEKKLRIALEKKGVHSEKLSLESFTQKPGYRISMFALLYPPPSESELREYKEILDASQECIRIDPSNRSCRIKMADVYKKLGIDQGVIDAYKDCFRFDPDDRICRLGLADSYFEANHIEEAINVYNDCVRNDPYSASLHYKLAKSYAKLGSYSSKKPVKIKFYNKAIEEYKIALQNKPDDKMAVDIYVDLGLAYNELGHFTETVKVSRNAIRVDPDSPIAHWLLGLTYLNLGDRTSALDQYKILKDLHEGSANDLFDEIYK